VLSPARPLPDLLLPAAPGVELAVWRHGPDPARGRTPFLLVHGLASNAHLWDGVAASLAAVGHPSVSVDLRGHGRSSKPDHAYDLTTVADDLVAILPALGFDGPAVLAGQSYGAIVVLEAARRLGEAVDAVACVDGGHIDLRARFPSWDDCARRLAPPATAGAPAELIEDSMRQAHADWPEAGLAGALACFELRGDGTVAPWLTRERHMEVLRGLWESDTPAIREATTHHTLLLTADDGMPGKPADVERARAQLRSVDVVWMRGHHDLHAQHPEAVADALLALVGPTG
jgi:pimeloyl-ACP methyl ester carboxylesterase